MSSDRTHDRTTYTITVDSRILAGGARRLAGYHTERLSWWEDEMAAAEAQLKEHGLTIQEYQQTGGARLQAQLDPGLAQRLQECQQKVASHRAARDDYQSWAIFFAHEPEQERPVNAADFRYFDLGQTIPVEASVPA